MRLRQALCRGLQHDGFGARRKGAARALQSDVQVVVNTCPENECSTITSQLSRVVHAEVAAMRMAQGKMCLYLRLLAMERTGLERGSWLHLQSKAGECKEEGLSLSQAGNSKPIRISQWCGLRIGASGALTFASDATNAARCDTW